MCNITTKLPRRQTVTGYKMAIEENGKYYSPATGVEYKTGPVPKLPRRLDIEYKRADLCGHTFRIQSIFDPTGVCHNKYMCYHKLTAIFVKKKDLIESSDTLAHDTVILRITLSGNLHHGDYTGPIFLGNHIDNITLVSNQ